MQQLGQVTGRVLLACTLVAAAAGGGCKGKGGTAAAGAGAGGQGAAPAPAIEKKEFDGVTIDGVGASFPFPIYSQWASTFNQLTGLKLNYQSIGSGGGIAQIKAKTVAFGASDAPLVKEELDAAGLVQFPMVIGGVVPVVHVEGVADGALRLTPALLAGIFLGKVKKWNDARIRAVNEGLALPARDISVVHRSDGSGTTWIFTSYLSKVSDEWRAKVGGDKSVAWPAGMGGKGNEGVAAFVQKVDGAIGYVEFAYARQNKIPCALLQNREGAFVAPTAESFQAAAASADWAGAPGMYMVLTDQPGAGSWPITGASFILVHKAQDDARRAAALLAFFDWCYRHGKEAAAALDYVPMPDAVADIVEKRWSESIAAGGAPLWPPAAPRP